MQFIARGRYSPFHLDVNSNREQEICELTTLVQKQWHSLVDLTPRGSV